MEIQSFWKKLEICLNTLNHAFIGISMFYSFWYCINYGFDGKHTWHEMCCSVGFNLLMAEGILAMYSGNTFTLFETRTTRKYLHGILQAGGGGLGLFGFFLEVNRRVKENKTLFVTQHAKFGLAAAIFLALSMLSGLVALFPIRLKNLIKPIFSKFFHNLVAIAAFVLGMISIIIGYYTRKPSRSIDPGYMNYAIIGLAIATIVLTLIGPLKAFYEHMRIFIGGVKEKSDTKTLVV